MTVLAPRPLLAPPGTVDAALASPVGFPTDAPDRLGWLIGEAPTADGWDRAARAYRQATDEVLAHVASGRSLLVGAPTTASARQHVADLAGSAAELGGVGGVGEGVLDVTGATARSLVARAQRAVLDHRGAHASVPAQAEALAWLAAAGTPIVCLDLSPLGRHLLGADLAALVAPADPIALLRDLTRDPTLRERHSVQVRRLALRRHAGLDGPVDATAVSVVLATRRADFLDLALSQYVRQDHANRELIVTLHGDAFPTDVPHRIATAAAAAGTPWKVVEVAAEHTLGDALNAGVAAADGDVVSKMDDDDWYGDEHLTDLLLAMRYSGADLVGKAAEFVHLAGSHAGPGNGNGGGLTVRRFAGGAESGSATLAGGTLTMRRDALRELGGFASVSLGEDVQLIADVEAAGLTRYRTHGFGYLLHRHGDHAWVVDPSTFTEQAVATRPGRDHDWTLT